MNCIYCEGKVIEVFSYPYPYRRIGIAPTTKLFQPISVSELQVIHKFECPTCNKPTFKETRRNINGTYHDQIYSYGAYQFKQGML